LRRWADGPSRFGVGEANWPDFLVPGIGKDDPLWSFRSIGQRDRAVGKLGTKRNHFLADPRQAEVGDLQDAVLGDEQIAGLDVAMAAQPLPRGVLHSLAELDAKPQRLDKVEAAATDPANQVPALNQLQNNVRLAFDDLDRITPGQCSDADRVAPRAGTPWQTATA